MEVINNPDQSVADRLIYGPKDVFDQLMASGIWTPSEHITGTKSDVNNIDQILARLKESTTLKKMMGDNIIIIPTRRKIIETHGSIQWGSQHTFNPSATPTLVSNHVIVTQVNALKTTAGTLGDLPFEKYSFNTTGKFVTTDVANKGNVKISYVCACYWEKNDMLYEKTPNTKVYNTVRWITHAGLCAINLAEQNYNGTHTMTSYGPLNFLAQVGRLSEGNAKFVEMEGSGMETATLESISFDDGDLFPIRPDDKNIMGGKDDFDTKVTNKVKRLNQINNMTPMRVRHEMRTLNTGTSSLKFEHPACDFTTAIPDPPGHSEKLAEGSGTYGESQKKITIKLSDASDMYKVGFSNFNILIVCSISATRTADDNKVPGPGITMSIRIPYIAPDSVPTGGETNNIKLSMGYHELGREYDRMFVGGNQTFTTFLYRTYSVSKTTSDKRISYNTSSLSLPTGGIMYGVRQVQNGERTFAALSTGINFGVFNIRPHYERVSLLTPSRIDYLFEQDDPSLTANTATIYDDVKVDENSAWLRYLYYKSQNGYSSMRKLMGYTLTCKEGVKSINFGLSSTTIINESTPQVHRMMHISKPIVGNSIFGKYLHRLELCIGGTDLDTVPGGFNLSRVNNVTFNVTLNDNVDDINPVEFALMFISTSLLEIAPGIKGQKVA